MTKLLLATAYTSEYARAPRYVAGLERFCHIPYQLLIIGKDMPSYDMPGSIVQAGFFLEHIKPCDVVIFTDADLLMHRRIAPDEIEFLSSLKEGQISACLNKPREEFLAEELPMLYQRGPTPQGFDDVKIYNTGFVAARVDTYKALFERFKALWPPFDVSFEHYAKIQLCMCCAAHELGLEWIVTPTHLCTHGHLGAHPGVDPHIDPPTFNGRVICFDHRLTH